MSDDQPPDQRPLDVGMALRTLRRHGDLSQRGIARRAGVPSSTVARIESGEITNPQLRTVERLVRAAGGRIWVGVEPHRPVEPIPHEHQADAAHRHYPAHLDLEVTFPYFGRDHRILPAGTAVHVDVEYLRRLGFVCRSTTVTLLAAHHRVGT